MVLRRFALQNLFLALLFADPPRPAAVQQVSQVLIFSQEIFHAPFCLLQLISLAMRQLTYARPRGGNLAIGALPFVLQLQYAEAYPV